MTILVQSEMGIKTFRDCNYLQFSYVAIFHWLKESLNKFFTIKKIERKKRRRERYKWNGKGR